MSETPQDERQSRNHFEDSDPDLEAGVGLSSHDRAVAAEQLDHADQLDYDDLTPNRDENGDDEEYDGGPFSEDVEDYTTDEQRGIEDPAAQREREEAELAEWQPFSESAVADSVIAMLGDSDWSGQEPYEVKVADSKVQKAYILQLRRGVDWITIQRRISDNPMLVETFLLELKESGWQYIDPYQIKYGESSLSKLEDVFNLLQKVKLAEGSAAVEAPSQTTAELD